MNPIRVTLENNFKSEKKSLFSIIEDAYEPFLYDVYTKETDKKMKYIINSILQQHFPLISTRDGVEFNIHNGNSVSINITPTFMKEMEEKYPEALI